MSETLLSGLAPADSDTGPEVTPLGEGRMVREDGWREVHRLFHVERAAWRRLSRLTFGSIDGDYVRENHFRTVWAACRPA